MRDPEYLSMLATLKYNDNQEQLVMLWGNAVPKLTPLQAQMVVEILKERQERKKSKLGIVEKNIN